MANPALNPNDSTLIDEIQKRLSQSRATLNLMMLGMDAETDWKDINSAIWGVCTLLQLADAAAGEAHIGYSRALGELTRKNLEQHHHIQRLEYDLKQAKHGLALRERLGD